MKNKKKKCKNKKKNLLHLGNRSKTKIKVQRLNQIVENLQDQIKIITMKMNDRYCSYFKILLTKQILIIIIISNKNF